MFVRFNRELLHIFLAVIIWLVVLGCAISSIYSQPKLSPRARRLWVLAVLALPLIGLLAYIPFSLDNPKIFREWYNKLFPGKTK